MNNKIIKSGKALLFIAGVAYGPFILESAYAARPPFDWGSVVLVFFGLLLGLPFVIGIQLIQSNPKSANLAVSFFSSISVFLFGSGVSAFALEAYKVGITPQGAFFLAAGTSMTIALYPCRVLSMIKEKKFKYQKKNQGEP